MTRFKKIKRTSEGKFHLEYEKLNQAGEWDEYSFRSSDEPLPEFEHALDNLIPHVVQACELPENDHLAHGYDVKGLSLSYGGDLDVMGVTVSVTRSLDNSNSPLLLNTPHKIEEPYAEGSDDTQVMPPDFAKDVHVVFHEAQRYLDGHRKQMSLFAEREEAVV